MLLALLVAGITLSPVEADEPVLDVRVADVDADGEEDVVAVTEKSLLLLRGGRGPLVRRPAAPLTVVGRGLLGVVRDGCYRKVDDPFGEWREGRPGPESLLAGLGLSRPALLLSPGDVDGDGLDDAVIATDEGFETPAGLVPVHSSAQLEIRRNEAFGVRWEIPVPAAGGWTAKRPELVFLVGGEIVAYRERREVDRLRLPLPGQSEEVEGLTRNHVLLRDVDGDGRLDLLVVLAKGRAGLFSAFEATAMYFPGGHVYSREARKFHQPRSRIKVAGALLEPALLDLDGDGDLDLVLSTVDTGILASATGTAPGTYHLFRFEDGAFQRNPAWTLRGAIPLTVFTEHPRAPTVFLPDLDRDGRPEALALGERVRLLRAGEDGAFAEEAAPDFEATGRPAVGRTLAALAGRSGVLVARGDGG